MKRVSTFASVGMLWYRKTTRLGELGMPHALEQIGKHEQSMFKGEKARARYMAAASIERAKRVEDNISYDRIIFFVKKMDDETEVADIFQPLFLALTKSAKESLKSVTKSSSPRKSSKVEPIVPTRPSTILKIDINRWCCFHQHQKVRIHHTP